MSSSLPPTPIVRPRSRRTVRKLAIVVGAVATCLGGLIELDRLWRGLPFRAAADLQRAEERFWRATHQQLLEQAADAEALNGRWRERRSRQEQVAINHLRPELIDDRTPEQFAKEARELAANCLALADHFAARARTHESEARLPPRREVQWDRTRPRLPFASRFPWPGALERYDLTYPPGSETLGIGGLIARSRGPGGR